jgi:iodotyrosine deiodinase
MNFRTKALGRQENKRPFLLIPLGFPAENAQIPSLKRKDSSEVIELYK